MHNKASWGESQERTVLERQKKRTRKGKQATTQQMASQALNTSYYLVVVSVRRRLFKVTPASG